MPDNPVIIEVALNGGRSREEHPNVPCTPEEVSADAERCYAAGASVVHLHAQDADGNWSADPAWYRETLGRIRSVAPDLLISITSIRPAPVPVDTVLESLHDLAGDPAMKPDLISINLGHIVNWERRHGSDASRQTVHFPNSYEDIVALLATCKDLGITPEFGLMDLGFVSNAVALRDGGLLPESPWFLIELDSPGYGSGRQVAPSSAANLDLFASLVAEHFPGARWAAHGVDLPGYGVVRRAFEIGGHVRVGLEDAVVLPDGRQPSGNVEMVEWAVQTANRFGRTPMTPSDVRPAFSVESS